MRFAFECGSGVQRGLYWPLLSSNPTPAVESSSSANVTRAVQKGGSGLPRSIYSPAQTMDGFTERELEPLERCLNAG
jgi:hypothetical protein